MLWATWRRHPLTTLLHVLIALHMLILILGGAYTYARVPLGFWLQEALHLGRNLMIRLGTLTVIKTVHTLVWALFASCIAAIPFAF